MNEIKWVETNAFDKIIFDLFGMKPLRVWTDAVYHREDNHVHVSESGSPCIDFGTGGAIKIEFENGKTVMFSTSEWGQIESAAAQYRRLPPDELLAARETTRLEICRFARLLCNVVPPPSVLNQASECNEYSDYKTPRDTVEFAMPFVYERYENLRKACGALQRIEYEIRRAEGVGEKEIESGE